MTLKKGPDELNQPKQSARRHRRSEKLLEQIRAARAQMREVYVTDEDLRAARDEGRP
ncbi:MAG: hypothetical protein ACJ8GN_01890 [Longimicrobiaceae bacterium]